MTAGRFQECRGFLGASALVALLSLSACKGTIGSPATGDLIPPNVCTSAQIALSNTACELTLGEWKSSFLAKPQEQDWYSVNVGNVDTLSIVHIIAGYFSPGDVDGGPADCSGGFNTAVNLTMNVLESDGETSLATGADIHGTACPTPMDITFKYTKPNQSLVIVLEDDTGAKVDTKNKYSIVADVVEDPDINEPNDTPATATPIPLTSSGSGVQSGESGGYLSTPGDIDYYSVTSPGANYVLWVQISQDPSVPSPPPHNYRLEYYVFAPDGTTQVAQGYANAGSQYSANQIVLADAVLINQAGPYYVLVQGYRDSNTVGAVPGDLNFKYLVQVMTLPLQDPTEPNNTFQTAFMTNGGTALPVGSSTTVTGRTSYVGDADWYAVSLAASAAPALLHYKLTPGTTGARFPALPTNPSRTLFGYTQAPDTTSCLTDAGVCVISALKNSTSLAIAQSACAEAPPKCLQTYRVESVAGAPGPVLTNLKNFESVLQVPPHAAAITYYFYLQAVGSNPNDNNGYWADDKDYTLLLEHMAEPDSLEMVPDPPRLATLGAAPGSIAGVPVYLSYGIGQLNPGHNINDVVFGPADYDGRGDDVDTYQISLPFTTQEAWQISWSVPVGPDGVNPDYDLGFTLSFCDVDAGTAGPPCSVMVTHPQSNSSDQLGFGYTDAAIDSWWNPAGATTPDQVAYTQTVSGGIVTTTVLPYACFCFEPRFVVTGTSYFLMNIFPVNRTSWSLAPYTVSTSYAPYPQSFSAPSGTLMCPATCDFTLN
jgi:hypothetical protein